LGHIYESLMLKSTLQIRTMHSEQWT